MNKINIHNIGEYNILTYQRAVKEGTLLEGDYVVTLNGSIYSTDIHEKIGHASNGCTYAITEEISPDKKTIVRRIYGNPPEYSYIKATQLQKVYDENAGAIAAAASIEEDKQQFAIELHKAINRAAAEILGKDSVVYDRIRTSYGDWANKYCTPILPVGRMSIPFIVTHHEYDGMVAMLDNSHPAADIRMHETYVGSKTHGVDTIVVERKSDGANFDLGRSYWPRYIPRNEENFGKALDYCKQHNKEILYEVDVLKATKWGLKVGKYRLVWDRRPAPKMTINGEYCVAPKGEIICADGSSCHMWLYGTDEKHYTKVLRTPSYIVTVRKLWEFSPTYIIITTYGEIPATSGLHILEDLWKENEEAIDAAAASFCDKYSKYRKGDRSIWGLL